MRKIDYWRHEFHSPKPEPRKAELPFFLLDIPYLFFEGIIPPLSVVNSVLRTGGGDAGMSPGTSWEPFVVTDREYAQLVQKLAELDVAEAKKKARFVPSTFRVDLSLHNHKDIIHWVRAVKKKYAT